MICGSAGSTAELQASLSSVPKKARVGPIKNDLTNDNKELYAIIAISTYRKEEGKQIDTKRIKPFNGTVLAAAGCPLVLTGQTGCGKTALTLVFAKALGAKISYKTTREIHTEPQYIDLHELQRLDVVLIPFDHLAIGHGGRLDRHQIVQPVVSEDKADRILTALNSETL